MDASIKEGHRPNVILPSLEPSFAVLGVPRRSLPMWPCFYILTKAPWMVGMTALQACPSLPAAPFPSILTCLCQPVAFVTTEASRLVILPLCWISLEGGTGNISVEIRRGPMCGTYLSCRQYANLTAFNGPKIICPLPMTLLFLISRSVITYYSWTLSSDIFAVRNNLSNHIVQLVCVTNVTTVWW
jgi:hypothetical protein